MKEEARLEEVMQFLQKVPFVCDFTRTKQRNLLENLMLVEYSHIGEVVVREGKAADKVYLIKEGEFSIHQETLAAVEKPQIEYLYRDERVVNEQKKLSLFNKDVFGLSKALMKTHHNIPQLKTDESAEYK